MLSSKYEPHTVAELISRIEEAKPDMLSETKHLEPLFKDEEDYAKFRERHDADRINRKPLAEATGKLYLGIDAGSTTTKAALIDSEKSALFVLQR